MPALTFYPPQISNRVYKDPSGYPVVLVFPGGGYNILAYDVEGTEVCEWLNRTGVACVLLKYRVPNTGPYPKSEAALQYAQRAVGVVRQHASAWQIDAKRVGVFGFSAGGHLAAALASDLGRAPLRASECGRQPQLPARLSDADLSGLPI